MGHNKKFRLYSILLITPSVLAIFVFVYGFIGFTGMASFINWTKMQIDYTFVGFNNYIRLFHTERFLIDLKNTLVFTVLFLISTIIIGFLLAVAVDQKIKGEAFFRNIFLFPMAFSFIVTGVVWRWLLAPGNAITGALGVNLILEKIGLGFLANGWYTDPKIGIRAVVIAAVWQYAGYVMALYLAGIRGIPEEIVEAARVDGATEIQVYRHIILPMVQPITLSAVIILGHISLKIFDLVVSMTGPGTGFSTDVPAFFMYDTTFRGNRFSEGSAIAIILLLLVAILVVPYLVNSSKAEVER